VIVFVARHGETDWNRAGRYQGQRESILTETGFAQAGALARALADRPIDRVFSSPLARCFETARPLARLRGCEVEVDERLVEIAHGTWEGRLRGEIEADDSETLRAWRERPETVRFSGGEALSDVAARWESFVADLAPGGEVAIVTHDVVVRLAILHAAGEPLSRLWSPRVVNGGYATFEVRDGRWYPLSDCVDAHLEGLRVDVSRQAL
jgi:probable phosphoglycerate mutase